MAEAAAAGAGGAVQETERGAGKVEGEIEGDGDKRIGGSYRATGVCVGGKGGREREREILDIGLT